jgi:formylglycine-generating enzyme required for sulfatase activity
MRNATSLLLALWIPAASLSAAEAAGEAGAPASDLTLSASFFTASFLSEVAARVEAARIEQERLAGSYLQEKTGLIWARKDNGADLDWYEAGEYCRNLEVADWADWRMPTIEEFESLHDRRSAAKYKLTPAIRLTGCCPWSQSRSGDSSAWNFSFRYRKRFSGSLNYSYELRALCVRTAGEDDVRFFEEAAAAEALKQR